MLLMDPFSPFWRPDYPSEKLLMDPISRALCALSVHNALGSSTKANQVSFPLVAQPGAGSSTGSGNSTAAVTQPRAASSSSTAARSSTRSMLGGWVGSKSRGS